MFDLDNTLFDHLTAARTGLAAFLRHLGVGHSGTLMQRWFEVERTNYDRWLSGLISFDEQRRERLRQFLPLAGSPVPQSDADLDELFAVYLVHYEASWTAFPDAARALRNLAKSGMLVGVMTNGNHVQQTKKIERIGLENLLDAIFSSEMVGHAKPSAEAFLIPCESLQVPPDEVLYVGDNYRMDVEGARNAGLSAIHLDRAAADPGPRTVRTLTELPTILEKRPVNSANNRG